MPDPDDLVVVCGLIRRQDWDAFLVGDDSMDNLVLDGWTMHELSEEEREAQS